MFSWSVVTVFELFKDDNVLQSLFNSVTYVNFVTILCFCHFWGH